MKNSKQIYFFHLSNRSLFPSKDDDDDDDEDEDSPAAHLEVQFFSVTTFYYIVRISKFNKLRGYSINVLAKYEGVKFEFLLRNPCYFLFHKNALTNNLPVTSKWY